MARIITGSNISQIRGKIGGTTYSAGLSGNIAKTRSHITKRTSARSYQARNITSILQNYWSSLTVAERTDWNNFALFKPTAQRNNPNRFLNGQSIYMLYSYAHYFQFGFISASPVYLTTPPGQCLRFPTELKRAEYQHREE